MHRIPRVLPVRVCTFALLVLLVIANALLSAPIDESVLMALLALGGTLIAADTARPSGMARGPEVDSRPLDPAVRGMLQRVLERKTEDRPNGAVPHARPAPAVTPGSGRPPRPELVRDDPEAS